MGISSMPSPSDSVMTTLVMNTVITISILKAIVRSVLRFLGIKIADPAPETEVVYYSMPVEPSLTERFRNRFKPVQFGSGEVRRRGAERIAECPVCLIRFQQDSVVNRLDCGHLFHRACLEKWLDYHHVTCPLCRTYVLPRDDDGSSSWSWF